MKKQSMEFLKKLIETPTPSGFEFEGQRLVMQEMEGNVDSVTSDIMGNVIGCINPESNLKVLLAGHCDEIGYMIQYIDDAGFLRIGTIGAPRLCCASGMKVLVHNSEKTISGVMMSKLIDEKKKLEIKDFWIDIGANNRKDAEKYVSVGDPITVDAGFFALNNNNVVARAFDDRIGSFIIVETLKRLNKSSLNVATYGVSTVQEETGGRGAQVCGFNINPDISIAIDVVHTSDNFEKKEEEYGRLALGKGPVLLKGCNVTPAIGELLVEVAEKNKIPYQMQAAPMPTWTDADPLQRMRGGSATALVKIPVRYMHAPTEIISLTDVENAIKLLVVFLTSIDKNINLKPVNKPIR